MRGRGFPVVAAFVVLAIVWTRPLAFHLASRIPHDPGDPVFNTWLLWWNAQALPFSSRWWNPPVFFPMRGALALSEHLAGIGVIATPVQLAGGNAVAAYNVAFILSFALSGLFTFLLVRQLLHRPSVHPFSRNAAALCAALAYGFGPYRAGQLAHLQVLSSQWMPLALLAMHRYLADGRARWLVLFAAAWIVQALSNGYYLLFFPVLLIGWLGWFVDWRRPARGFGLLACLAASSLALVPPLITYATVHRGLGLGRTSAEMALFSAKPQSFLQPPAMLAFWRARSDAATTEEFLFPGVTVLLLVGAGVAVTTLRQAHRREWGGARSPLPFYAGAALLLWAFAFGPATPDSPLPAWVRPYSMLAWLPGYDALRVPARFAMLATLCAAVAGGLSFAALSPRRVTARSALAAVVLTGLCLDGWMRAMPLAAPPGRAVLPPMPNALVLELPAEEGIVNVGAMYRQTEHGLPIVNGYSGYVPPHYRILSMAIRRGDPSVFAEIGAGRPLLISVNQGLDGDGAIRRLVEGLPGAYASRSSGGGAMFVVPASPVRRVAPAGDRWPGVLANDGDVATLDLGEIRVVRSIAFPVRWHYAELSTRMSIEGSTDGANWITVWDDWTGGSVLAAALADPIGVPVRLTMADIRARYLRVRPAPSWMRREIAAYGPR